VATRVLVLLFVVEVLACAADLALGPYARLHWEEVYNVREGLQIACDHAEAAYAMQYRAFCGGCTAEAWMAVPVFAVLGPSVLAWKLVPLTFHLAIVAAGALFLRRHSDRAAAAWLLLMIGAPGAYRDLAWTGWGNHAESTAFVLIAGALLLSPRPGWARHLAAGGIAGLGVWFCYTSLHGLPAVLVVAQPALLPVLALGVAGGFAPRWWFHQARPQSAELEADKWLGVELAPPERLWEWFAGDYLRTSLWDPLEYWDLGSWPTVWWAGLVVATVWGLLRVRGQRVGRFAAAALFALVAAYALRHDLWYRNPDLDMTRTFNLRYRAPLVPLLMLGAAWGPRGLVVPIALFGLVQRASLWDADRGDQLDRVVYTRDATVDKTVPTGDPPQRRARMQGRPQDVAAALEALAGHDDLYPSCRQHHVYELGRRVGIGLSEGWIGGTVASDARAIARGAEERIAFDEGAGRRLVSTDGELAVTDVPDALLPAVGRRAHDDLPASHPGVCEARGEAWVAGETDLGAWRPSTKRPTPGACDAESFADGVGRGWAWYVGCSDGDRVLLIDRSPAAIPAWEQACEDLRVPW